MGQLAHGWMGWAAKKEKKLTWVIAKVLPLQSTAMCAAPANIRQVLDCELHKAQNIFYVKKSSHWFSATNLPSSLTRRHVCVGCCNRNTQKIQTKLIFKRETKALKTAKIQKN